MIYKLDYQDGATELEASISYPKANNAPIILVCHAWSGKDQFAEETVARISEWGYVGVAIDMYGKGVVGKSQQENARLKQPFLDDRALLKNRLQKGFDLARSLKDADGSKVAAIGFGFGGLCALDLARSKVALKGAVAFYGHFEESAESRNQDIKSKILILHGAEDSVVPASEVLEFGTRLNKLDVDWQCHIFGRTLHAFMNPASNAPAVGIAFQEDSAKRAWQLTRCFLDELLS